MDDLLIIVLRALSHIRKSPYHDGIAVVDFTSSSKGKVQTSLLRTNESCLFVYAQCLGGQPWGRSLHLLYGAEVNINNILCVGNNT